MCDLIVKKKIDFINITIEEFWTIDVLCKKALNIDIEQFRAREEYREKYKKIEHKFDEIYRHNLKISYKKLLKNQNT